MINKKYQHANISFLCHQSPDMEGAVPKICRLGEGQLGTDYLCLRPKQDFFNLWLRLRPPNFIAENLYLSQKLPILRRHSLWTVPKHRTGYALFGFYWSTLKLIICFSTRESVWIFHAESGSGVVFPQDDKRHNRVRSDHGAKLGRQANAQWSPKNY